MADIGQVSLYWAGVPGFSWHLPNKEFMNHMHSGVPQPPMIFLSSLLNSCVKCSNVSVYAFNGFSGKKFTLHKINPKGEHLERRSVSNQTTIYVFTLGMFWVGISSWERFRFHIKQVIIYYAFTESWRHHPFVLIWMQRILLIDFLV